MYPFTSPISILYRVLASMTGHSIIDGDVNRFIGENNSAVSFHLSGYDSNSMESPMRLPESNDVEDQNEGLETHLENSDFLHTGAASGNESIGCHDARVNDHLHSPLLPNGFSDFNVICSAHNSEQESSREGGSMYVSSQQSLYSSPRNNSSYQAEYQEEQITPFSVVFSQWRDNCVAVLQMYRNVISHGSSDEFFEIEAVLNDISQRLSIFSYLTASMNLIEQPADCFRIRVSRIESVIDLIIDAIRSQRGFGIEISECLYMIALQIGRLTLYEDSNYDRNATRFNDEANEFDEILRMRISSLDVLEERDRKSHEAWELMTRETSFCNCRQCYQGRFSSNLR